MNKRISLLFIFFFLMSNIYAQERMENNVHRNQLLLDGNLKSNFKYCQNIVNFFKEHTSQLGLINSFTNSSFYEYDKQNDDFYKNKKPILDDQAFTYDNAVAVIAYLLCNHRKEAYKILNIYKKAFYRLDFGMEVYGLYNVYRTDKVKSNGELEFGIDGDRTHVGPNVWVGLAALQYTAITGDLEFLPFVIDMCKWIDNILPHYKMKDGSKGVVSMGTGSGLKDWSKVFATENIIDYYALLKMIKVVCNLKNVKIKRIFKERRYSQERVNIEMHIIERWLKEVIYDKSKHAFNVGINESRIDYNDALDTVSWAILGISPERLRQMGVDPFYLMKFADTNFLVEDKIKNTVIKGYDFTNYKKVGREEALVWFEGTAFHVVAMLSMSIYSQREGFKDKSQYFKQEMEFFLGELNKASNLCDIEYNALPYTSKKAQDYDVFYTFGDDWEIPRGRDKQWVSSLSSTAWYIIAILAFNPMSFDNESINYKLFK